MRILLVNKYWRRQGGVEEYCFLLKSVLESLGHEVVPFAQAEVGTLETPWSSYFVPPVDPTSGNGRERIRGARRAVFGDETSKAIRSLIRDVGVDAAHVVHSYHQLGPMFMRVLEELSVPTLLSIHDYKLCCPSYRLMNDVTGRVCTICLDSPSRRATAPFTTKCWRGSSSAGALLGLETVAVNRMKPYQVAGRVLVSNELMRRCALSGGIEEHKIQVVPNFWPVSDPSAERAAGEHHLFVGRLVREKGVDVLIRAAAASNVPVRVIGDGPLRAELETLALSLGAPVVFLGQQWDSQVEAEMLACNALIVPSTWHEVSPLVIYQAMTLGVPVIASEMGGIPDLLNNGRGTMVTAGDVAGLTDAMVRAVREPQKFSAAARSALAYASTELSRERFVDRLGEAYDAVGIAL